MCILQAHAYDKAWRYLFYNQKNWRVIFLRILCYFLSFHVDSSQPTSGYNYPLENSCNPKVSIGTDYYYLSVPVTRGF